MNKRISLLIIVSLFFLSACEKEKPTVDISLPAQGPNFQEMQPTQNPN